MDLLRRPSLLQPELEIVLGRVRVREELARRLDLLGRVVMGRARDCDLVLREVVARAHERQCLDRFRGGAHEADELRVAGARDDLAAAHRDSMYAVPRLDDSVPAHLDDDRLAHGSEHYADLRMVGICRTIGKCRPLERGTTTRPRR